MKRSKFSEQQIAFILRLAEEGTRVEEACRKAGTASQPDTATNIRQTARTGPVVRKVTDV